MPVLRLLERRPFLTPLLIFGITRLVSGVLLSVGAAHQAALTGADTAYKLTHPTPASPGYLGVVANWDGQWFWSIATHGYPSVLPRVDGQAIPNEWAFTPGYPFLVRAVMFVGRIDFPLAATAVSLASGAAAMVILHGMVRKHMDSYAATSLVLALCCFPSAPVFQVAYAESLALLLVVLALRSLADRRQGWFVFFAALLSVTRPVLLPMAAVAGVVWVLRWSRRRAVPFPRRDRWTSAAAACTCAGLVGTWPTVAALATRDSSAFTDTMAAWPANKELGGAGANWITLSVEYPAILVVAVVPLVLVTAYAAFRRPARVLPASWRWWGPVYFLYMLVATKPSIGIVRYALLAVFPLAPFLEPAPPMTTPQRVARLAWTTLFVLAGFIGQYFWVTRVFTIDVAPTGQIFP